MHTFDALFLKLASDAEFRAMFVADPETTLNRHDIALSDGERTLLARLLPILAMPAKSLLVHLVGPGPDGPPLWWMASPQPEAVAG